MARKYYYLANISEDFGQTRFWDHCVYAESAEQAKKIYSEEYYKKFGNYPIAVSTRRTDKATFEDINNRNF